MAKQKQVFPRDTVAHLWAHKAQDCARDPGGNFYFTGPTIYSYGAHFAMAHILDERHGAALAGVVLINDESRSNTTSKHQSIMRGALTRQQRENALYVPGMNDDTARAIDRALIKKELPAKCLELAQYIREAVARIEGKKHGSGPFCEALRDARKYQKTLMAFYARAGKKYPLPVVPESMDDVPADKPARAAFVLQFAKAHIEGEYKKNVLKAQAAIASYEARCEREADKNELRALLNWTGLFTILRDSDNAAREAVRQYVTLHGADKKQVTAPRLVKKLEAAMADVSERNKAVERVAAWGDAERATMHYLYLRRAVSVNPNPRDVRNLQSAVAHGSVIETRIKDYPFETAPWFDASMQKLIRAEHMAHIVKLINRARSDISIADSYFDANNNFTMGDVARHYRGAMRGYAYAETMASQMGMSGRAWAFFAGDMVESIKKAKARCEEIEAREAERNAATIAAWVAGKTNQRPSGGATYARIRGAIVETTRGASVPIEHACRLARMYAATVRRGGAQWADGKGPMVGHYRVNAIGADGSLVIGCHEFTPIEAKRLHGVLSACAECAATEKGE